MPVMRKTISFGQQIAIDREGNPYVYGGNWDPFNRATGTDCSGCVVDELDGAINGTAMAWSRHGLSTEDWRPPSMGGGADPNNGPFGTVMADSPDDFPADAAVLIAFHHGPGGGENSHTWCQVDKLKVETNGDAGTILWDGVNFFDGVRDVHLVDTPQQYGANNWWYLPGPIVEDGTPIPTGRSPQAASGPAEPQDTLFADVSEFQCPLDDTYWAATYMDQGAGPFNFRWVSIRSNDGDHIDANFAANYANAVGALNDGRADGLIVYYYWRPGTDALVNHIAQVNAAGGPHPRMVSMIDLESGGNPDTDVSDQVNNDYFALAGWLGDERRVIGYANVSDERTMWQTKPVPNTPMILAGYGSNPVDSTVFKIAHQYTDGTGYGDGLPEGAPPFGDCDMNSADGLSPSQLANLLGVGANTPVPAPPAPAPAPQTCTVQPGDSLSSIADRLGVTLAALEAANPQIADPNQIYTGQLINIP